VRTEYETLLAGGEAVLPVVFALAGRSLSVLKSTGALVVCVSRTLVAGYVVSLVPAQSYFDVTTAAFDLSLLHAYQDFHPEFHYRGMNAYAALVAKFGTTSTSEFFSSSSSLSKYSGGSAPSSTTVATFDMIMVQLYETFSRACQAINGEGMPVRARTTNVVRLLWWWWWCGVGVVVMVVVVVVTAHERCQDRLASDRHVHSACGYCGGT
jgi:hypothetical protein